MKKRLWLYILGLCIFPARAFDLEQAWEAAEQYSAEYRAAEYGRDAEQEKEQQAQSALYPRIGLQSDYQRQASDLSSSRSQYGWQVQVSQSLYDPEKTARYRQSQTDSETAQARLATQLDDLKLKVSQSYFEVLLAEENVQAAKTEKAAYQKQIEQAKKLFRHGAATAVDVYEAQAGYDAALAKEIDALGRKQQAQNQLGSYTGLPIGQLQPVDTRQLIERFQAQIDRHSLNEWQEAALRHNNEYRTLKSAVRSAEQGIYLVKAANRPKVQLQLAYQDRHYRPHNGNNHHGKGFSAVLQLNIPLYSGGENRSRLREAAARHEETNYRLLAAERRIRLAVAQAHSESDAARYQILSQQRLLDSNRLKLKATETGKQYGIRNTLEVVRARQDVATAEQGLAQARYRYMAAFLSLVKESGMNMTEAWRAVNMGGQKTEQTVKTRSVPHRIKPKKRYWLHQVRMAAV
ncbi:TolC family protein [Conchiformibius steedae]|uniref:TolC family protein n=1 Tax=Conchiformibius steedae TaxID=153493 RepID=A0A3P2A1X4_9NEIS|nr:TolC family protein [Conchiformibius steedae]RRD89431.1 TolC family protein [Conchiformibius steedae]